MATEAQLEAIAALVEKVVQEQDPRSWSTTAIMVLSAEGAHVVVTRAEAVQRLEALRPSALAFPKALRDLQQCIDFVKASGPLDVPAVLFFQEADGSFTNAGMRVTVQMPKPRGPAN